MSRPLTIRVIVVRVALEITLLGALLGTAWGLWDQYRDERMMRRFAAEMARSEPR